MEPLNILLVDDQPAKLLTYEAMLGGLGANSSRRRRRAMRSATCCKEDIAVVLMDVNMPEVDGFELAAMIREHPRCRRTAIIFVSAVHLTDTDRLRGYETGAVDYVSVPVVPEILRAKIGVFLDLYRKSTELEHLNATLEERVAARTAELEQSIRQLRESENRLRQQREALAEADRRKNEFLAMLAHELRNPLQPIRTAIELARQPKPRRRSCSGAARSSSARSSSSSGWSTTCSTRAGSTAASSSSAGRSSTMSQIVAAAVDSVRPLADRAARAQRSTCVAPTKGSRSSRDGVRLTQVFLNLLNNAVKFTPDGGNIALSVARENGEIAVRVRDDGAGSVGNRARAGLRDVLSGRRTRGRRQGGLGLGLALVRQLVELHGGTRVGAKRGPRSGKRILRAAAGAIDGGDVRSERRARFRRAGARILATDPRRRRQP